MFDAMTGKYVLSIVNATTMSVTFDQSGNLVGYYVNATDHTLNMWNSTQAIVVGTNGLAAWQWRPTQNALINFTKGIMWSKPIATNISGNALPANLAIRNNDGTTLVLNVYAPVQAAIIKRMGSLRRIQRNHRTTIMDRKLNVNTIRWRRQHWR